MVSEWLALSPGSKKAAGSTLVQTEGLSKWSLGTPVSCHSPKTSMFRSTEDSNIPDPYKAIKGQSG